MNVFVNDPAPDVSLSVWLLKNHGRVSGHGEAIINRLVAAEDKLDATAGAYPFDPSSELVQELNWIFAPYNQSKISGHLFQATGSEMATIISSVGERITLHTMGSGRRLPLDTTFEKIGGGPSWAMINDTGPGTRTGLYQTGVRAFVAVTELGNATYKYSVGKMSPFIAFPIEEIYDLLNKAENLEPTAIDKWGGGDTIGGSPRAAGSTLTPSMVEHLINKYMGAVCH